MYQFMTKIQISCIFLLTVFSSLQAQEVYQLNITQAVEMGTKNSIELKNLSLDFNIQEQKNKEITSTIYPTIAATGGITYYTNVPQIQFPSSDQAIYNVLNKEGVKDQNGNVISTGNA